jgi:hypothetical protein
MDKSNIKDSTDWNFDDSRAPVQDDVLDEFEDDDLNHKAGSLIEPKKEIIINRQSQKDLANGFENSGDFGDSGRGNDRIEETFKDDPVEDNFEDDFEQPSPKREGGKGGVGQKVTKDFEEDFDDDFDEGGTPARGASKKESEFDFGNSEKDKTGVDLNDEFFDDFGGDKAGKNKANKGSKGNLVANDRGTSPLMRPKEKPNISKKPPSNASIGKHGQTPNQRRDNSQPSARNQQSKNSSARKDTRSQSKTKLPAKPPKGGGGHNKDMGDSKGRNFRINSISQLSKINKGNKQLDQGKRGSRIYSGRSNSRNSADTAPDDYLNQKRPPKLHELVKLNKQLHED